MQAAVVEAAEEASLYQRELWAEQTEASREAVAAAGVVINAIADKGPFQEAMAPVYADYIAANPDMEANGQDLWRDRFDRQNRHWLCLGLTDRVAGLSGFWPIRVERHTYVG